MTLLDTPKANYGGTYRAVCLEVLPDRVRAQVPQVFATTVITIFEFAGLRPAEGDEGWVSFESGLAERPIWVGSESRPPELPPGGALGQVLTKESALDRDVDWEEVFPLGGVAGDLLTKQVGGSEAWVTPASPSYWFSAFSGPVNITGGIGQVQLTPGPALLAAGFHRHANGTVVVCDVAGLYRIGVHLTENGSGAGGSAPGYTDTYIEIREPVSFAVVWSSNPVGGHALNNATGSYITSDGELIANIPAGYYINIEVAADVTRQFSVARSYLTIIPIGGGPKGEKGDRGLAGGTSTPWTLMVGGSGWNNYTPSAGPGFAQAAYRLHDDVVECRGLVYSTGTPVAVISNLPAGFRPPSGNQIFICLAATGGVRVDVTTAGDITYSTTPIAYLDLSPIRFSITP